jgi:plastocyanin
MSRLLALLTCGALTLACLAVDAAGGEKKKGPAAGGKKHEVIMLDNKYKPEKITIAVGDTIVWVNKGKKTHTASSGEKVPKALEFDTEDVDAGEKSKPIKFLKEGKIPYVCIHHRDMKGEVIVKARPKSGE